MPTVFLSYRKSDTRREAGRLSDSFRQKVGTSWVFRDIADIHLGAEFDAVLDRELGAARVVAVLIGPGWSGELARRLQQPDIDYVRVEVAQALATGKRVIPVLLEGAALPQPGELPEDLEPLARRQAMTLRDESWSGDVDRLIDAIGRPYRWGMLALRAALTLSAILVAVWLLTPQLAPDRVSDYVFMRWLVVWLAGAYGVIELSIGYLHYRRLS